MHYFVKHAFKNTILTSFEQEGQLEIHAVTDEPEGLALELVMKYLDFKGKVLWEDQENIKLKGNTSQLVRKLPVDRLRQQGDLSSSVLVTSMYSDENLLVASWNIKEFGHLKKRLFEAYFYIAEILSRFDLARNFACSRVTPRCGRTRLPQPCMMPYFP